MKSLDVVALGSCYVDINAERFPIGPDGIPPETELAGDRYELQAGGSAVNFCQLLGTLGIESAFVGMAGQDRTGDILESLMEDSSVRSEIIRRPDLQTNVSFNMSGPEGAHVMCVVGNANAALGPKDVLPRLSKTSEEAKMIYLGGCFKLDSFADSFPQVAEIAEDSPADLVVDHGRIPKDASSDMLESVKELVLSSDYYFPSRQEFCQLWEIEDIEAGLRLLNDQASNLTAVVKDGDRGAFYFSEGSIQHVPAKKVDAEDATNVTGAGDSFNAGVMAALLRDAPLADAVDYGCSVAAAKISGQQIPELES